MTDYTELLLSKEKTRARQIMLSAMLIALGVLLPIFSHVFGAGNIILPMHIPVLIAGFCLSSRYAVAVGLLTPLLSTLLTGMPVLIPMLPIMALELSVYALAAGKIIRLCKCNIYPALILTMIAGRIAALVAVFILTYVFAVQMAPPLVYIGGAIVSGVPGLIIQIIFVPPLVRLIRRNYFGIA